MIPKAGRLFYQPWFMVYPLDSFLKNKLGHHNWCITRFGYNLEIDILEWSEKSATVINKTEPPKEGSLRKVTSGHFEGLLRKRDHFEIDHRWNRSLRKMRNFENGSLRKLATSKMAHFLRFCVWHLFPRIVNGWFFRPPTQNMSRSSKIV